jgi:hypothetical protein
VETLVRASEIILIDSLYLSLKLSSTQNLSKVISNGGRPLRCTRTPRLMCCAIRYVRQGIAVRTIEISQTHTRAFYLTCHATWNVEYMNLGSHLRSPLHVSYYLRHQPKNLRCKPSRCIKSAPMQPTSFVVLNWRKNLW